MQEIQACQNIVTLSPHGIYLFHGVYSLRFFILFLLLILRRELQTFWEQKLRAKYPSPLDVLHEMFPVRFTEHADGSAHIISQALPLLRPKSVRPFLFPSRKNAGAGIRRLKPAGRRQPESPGDPRDL